MTIEVSEADRISAQKILLGNAPMMFTDELDASGQTQDVWIRPTDFGGRGLSVATALVEALQKSGGTNGAVRANVDKDKTSNERIHVISVNKDVLDTAVQAAKGKSKA